MAQSSTYTSPLFKLPAELRNSIHHMALQASATTMQLPVSRPSLLKVCKQITSEVASIFCYINEFHVYITTASVEDLESYLGTFGEDGAKALSNLRLTLDLEDEYELQRGRGRSLVSPQTMWTAFASTLISIGARPEAVTIRV